MWGFSQSKVGAGQSSHVPVSLCAALLMPVAPVSCAGAGHPMKPHRLSLTHSLVLHYGLYKKMMVRLTPLPQWLCLLMKEWMCCIFPWLRCLNHIKLRSMTCVAFTPKTTLTSCRRSAPTTCRASQRASTPSTSATTGELKAQRKLKRIDDVEQAPCRCLGGECIPQPQFSRFPGVLTQLRCVFQSCVPWAVWVLLQIHRSLSAGGHTAQPQGNTTLTNITPVSASVLQHC